MQDERKGGMRHEGEQGKLCCVNGHSLITKFRDAWPEYMHQNGL